MASLSPTTAPMSAKDGRSGSEGKKGPPLVQRMAHVSLAAFSRIGRPYGRVSGRADAGNRGERLPHRYVISHELTLRLRRWRCCGRHGWAGARAGRRCYGPPKSPGSPPYPLVALTGRLGWWRGRDGLGLGDIKLAAVAGSGPQVSRRGRTGDAGHVGGLLPGRRDPPGPRGFASNAPPPGAEQAVGNPRQIV